MSDFTTEINENTNFENPHFFDQHIYTPFAISDNGYIGTWQVEKKDHKLIVFHATEITGFEIAEKTKSGFGGAVAGGLMFGTTGALVGSLAGAGKASQIDLVLKTTNLSNPAITIRLYDKWAGMAANPNARRVAFSASSRIKKVDAEIMALSSALEALLARVSAQQAAVQQASPADELAKFKGLLDSGVITQEEFDVKKKQLLGL